MSAEGWLSIGIETLLIAVTICVAPEWVKESLISDPFAMVSWTLTIGVGAFLVGLGIGAQRGERNAERGVVGGVHGDLLVIGDNNWVNADRREAAMGDALVTEAGEGFAARFSRRECSVLYKLAVVDVDGGDSFCVFDDADVAVSHLTEAGSASRVDGYDAGSGRYALGDGIRADAVRYRHALLARSDIEDKEFALAELRDGKDVLVAIATGTSPVVGGAEASVRNAGTVHASAEITFFRDHA